MEDLNGLLRRQEFDVVKLRRGIVVALLLYVGLVIYLMMTIKTPTRPIVHLLLRLVPFSFIALLAWLVVRVHRALSLLGRGGGHSSKGMVALTLMFFSSLPILQAEINTLLTASSRRNQDSTR